MKAINYYKLKRCSGEVTKPHIDFYLSTFLYILIFTKIRSYKSNSIFNTISIYNIQNTSRSTLDLLNVYITFSSNVRFKTESISAYSIKYVSHDQC